jgi:AMMECR1 domain-containing protein
LALMVLLVAVPVAAIDLVGDEDPIFQAQALHLARTALTGWVMGRAIRISPALTPALQAQSGVFVSLENRRLVVRGCRGTLQPRTARLADEIVANVREACLQDPLHPPVKPAELDDIRIVLCVPGQGERVFPGQVWDVHRYGVLVEAGSRAAVMLPWEAPDSEHQVRWGRRRAQIAPSEAAHLVRFAAVRFAEAFPPKSRPAPPEPPRVPYW